MYHGDLSWCLHTEIAGQHAHIFWDEKQNCVWFFFFFNRNTVFWCVQSCEEAIFQLSNLKTRVFFAEGIFSVLLKFCLILSWGDLQEPDSAVPYYSISGHNFMLHYSYKEKQPKRYLPFPMPGCSFLVFWWTYTLKQIGEIIDFGKQTPSTTFVLRKYLLTLCSS